ncbi:hypothetical protein KAS08_00270 [Candidatus Pacearchaeota archaeon]|nr:hypothetical protein [Candidatus Pacearchaeota archaeon]
MRKILLVFFCCIFIQEIKPTEMNIDFSLETIDDEPKIQSSEFVEMISVVTSGKGDVIIYINDSVIPLEYSIKGSEFKIDIDNFPVQKSLYLITKFDIFDFSDSIYLEVGIKEEFYVLDFEVLIEFIWELLIRKR